MYILTRNVAKSNIFNNNIKTIKNTGSKEYGYNMNVSAMEQQQFRKQRTGKQLSYTYTTICDRIIYIFVHNTI